MLCHVMSAYVMFRIVHVRLGCDKLSQDMSRRDRLGHKFPG
jgi:hypothetical protein